MSHAHPCQVHAQHHPTPADVEVHHVWPKGQGGPDVPQNRVAVCPTGHTNVHALLRLALAAGGVDAVDWDTRRAFHPAERALARAGYWAIQGDPLQRLTLGGG